MISSTLQVRRRWRGKNFEAEFTEDLSDNEGMLAGDRTRPRRVSR